MCDMTFYYYQLELLTKQAVTVKGTYSLYYIVDSINSQFVKTTLMSIKLWVNNALMFSLFYKHYVSIAF